MDTGGKKDLCLSGNGRMNISGNLGKTDLFTNMGA